MKFGIQIVLAIVAVVGLVAGIAYVSQFYNSKGSSASQTGPVSKQGMTLTFPVKIVAWDPPTAGEFELHMPGHHDFWFVNKNAAPVDLGLMAKSCKCSDIKVCILGPEEAKYYVDDEKSEAVALIGSASQGILGLLGQLVQGREACPDLQRVKVSWTKLEPQMALGMMNAGNSVSVPPQASGLIRFSWDGKKTEERAERLNADLWTQAKEGRTSAREYVKLELPVVYVPAVKVLPEKVDLEDLNPKETRAADFVCWSPTRASFTLNARAAVPDPCVTCSVVPMTAEEREKLSEKEKSRVLAGYRVRITVQERTADGRQMDIGPFAKRLILTSDAMEEEISIGVVGAVLGEIVVGADEDKGKILLQSFAARTGTMKEVIILAQQPGVELKTDEVKIEPASLDHVKATLKADRAGRWKLLVKVLPGGPAGKLPGNAAIVLKIPGPPARQVRIPIRGTAYQQ
jgi:hypothetical protein